MAQPTSSTIDWNKGATVQLFPVHHQISTAFLWAHNLLESEPTQLARYDYKPKPAGWGNAGGGLEPDDREKLVRLFPDHPFPDDPFLTDDQKLIIAGGIREFISETGYKEFDVITDYPGVFLYDYKYRDWVDSQGVLHPGGHRKITLWAQIRNYRVYEECRIEKHEVDRTEWFDMADPLPSYFFKNPVRFPDRPYWSHVRFSLVSRLRIYGHEKANSDHFVPNIPGRIHPSWWYIFKVVAGDEVLKPSPKQWYKLFDVMVKKRLEEVDNDFLYNLFRDDLDKAKQKEEEAVEAPLVTQALDDSEDSDGVPTVEEMREKEDEEYRKWFEDDMSVA